MTRFKHVSQAFDFRRFRWLFVCVLLVISSTIWAEENSIQGISTIQQGANLIVRVTMKSPPSNPPVGFTVASPARVALDFLGTSNGSGRTTYELNQGDLRSINVVQVGDRTRLVLNLKRLVNYNTSIEGEEILVTLSPQSSEGASEPATAATRFAAPSASAGAHGLRDIDFRRGPDGEGRVIVDLSDSQTGIDIRTQGQTIVVDFLKASLPENLRRRLSVTDFATPVQTINTFAQGENTRMVIEPRGLWEHNAYQTDNRLVIEVRPVKEDPTKLFTGTKTGYKGERLSLNFQNVDIRSLLQVIGDFTNLNIITSDSVGGNLTLRLKDVPWDQALDIIMQSKGLDMRKNGNVILIAPKDELATKEKLDLEAQAQIADLVPLRSETFQLNYTKADAFKEVLTDESGNKRILSKRGRAFIDPRTNQLFITDIPAKLEELRQLIGKTDIASRQVLIEARIVEADDTFSRNLGARLGVSTGPQRSMVTGGSVAIGANAAGVSNSTAGQPVIVYPLAGQATELAANQNAFSLPAAGLSGFNPGALAVTLFNSSFSKFISLELSALEADGRGKIVSSPRVVTADQVKALIEQGTELPYQVATSSGATSIQFRKANLKLEVTPQITPEGNVILDVDVNKDSVGQITTAGFAIDTKHVQTKVLVENGGTVVLGGIFISTESNNVTQVPLLGDIPVLGNLFKSTSKTNNKTELLVFITPKIISERINVR